jgi:hypothetical protein
VIKKAQLLKRVKFGFLEEFFANLLGKSQNSQNALRVCDHKSAAPLGIVEEVTYGLCLRSQDSAISAWDSRRAHFSSPRFAVFPFAFFHFPFLAPSLRQRSPSHLP